MALSSKETTIICAIITTLAALPNGEAPEGVVYAGLMAHCGLAEFQSIERGLIGARLIDRVAGPCLKITDAGRKIAAELEAAMKA